jgi:hypothetical protein
MVETKNSNDRHRAGVDCSCGGSDAGGGQREGEVGIVAVIILVGHDVHGLLILVSSTCVAADARGGEG